VLIGELAGLANAATWAFTSIILGGLAGRHSALRVNAIRMTSGALYFLVAIPLAGGLKLFAGLTPGRALALGGTSILAQAIGDMLFVIGIGRIGAARASPISVSSFPLITLVLGALLLGERLTWSIAAGAALIVGGIVLLVLRSGVPPEDVPVPGSEGLETLGEVEQHVPAGKSLPLAENLIGLGIVLTAALAWSASTIWLRVLSPGLPAITVTAVRVPSGALFLLAILGAQRRLTLHGLDQRALILLCAAGVIGTGFGSMLYIIAVQRTSAGLAALLVSTSPLWTLPLAAIFLHERITRRVLLGATLTLAGIWLVLI
jgi:drug/metabolite transporter (DMT)-like permease